MAGRRTRGSEGLEPGRSAARAAAIAEQLHGECGLLLELFRKKESIGTDLVLPDLLLVSVPPPSSQLDVRDQLWRVHSALSQCHCLLERAIAREEQAVGVGVRAVRRADYQKQRKTVKDRLALLLASTREVEQALGGSTGPTPALSCIEPDGPAVLFEVKIWIYRIFRELNYWSHVATNTLQALPLGGGARRSLRSRRSARR